MQRKVKLVMWGSAILALLIMPIHIFIGGSQLVAEATESISLHDRPSCQLMNETSGDTQLTFSNNIPNRLDNLLTGGGGRSRYRLRCKPNPDQKGKGAPCIEVTPQKCVPVKKTPAPAANPSPVPSVPASSNTPPPVVNTPPPVNPNAPKLACGIQSIQLVCTVTGPNGTSSPVTCGLQSGQIACNGAGLIPLLSSIAGMPVPSNGTVSCGYLNGQLSCTGGSTPGQASAVTCQFQNGQAMCSAPLPQNLSVTIPPPTGNIGCQQSQKGGPITCTIPGLPPLVISPMTTSSSSRAGTLQISGLLTDTPSCQLVTGSQGNTELTISGDIPGNVKGLLEKKDGTMKFSLLCDSVT